MENTCKNATANECLKCGKYFSSHSWHYDSYYDQEILNINCSVGENKVFSEDGINIEK